MRRDPSCSCTGKTEDSRGGSAWDPRGKMLRPIVHGTAAGAPPPPPPPPLFEYARYPPPRPYSNMLGTLALPIQIFYVAPTSPDNRAPTWRRLSGSKTSTVMHPRGAKAVAHVPHPQNPG